jgi:hypothetical protein
MFFIFGSPRSGTTLLAQTLTAHSGIEIPYETDFIVPAAFIFDRVRDAEAGRPLLENLIVSSTAFKNSLGHYLSAGDVREIIVGSGYDLTSLLDALYAAVARSAGKRLAGDKSPNDLQFVRMVLKGLGMTDRKPRTPPAIKIVHLVRDLRDVMVSVKERGWTRDIDLYFPRMWNASNLYLHSLLAGEPSGYHLLRYEDMVSEPERVFGEICSFLSVDFEAAMLDGDKRAARFRRMPHHQGLFKPISTERVGAYRRELDPALVAQYERQAGEALEVFGYGTSDASR